MPVFLSSTGCYGLLLVVWCAMMSWWSQGPNIVAAKLSDITILSLLNSVCTNGEILALSSNMQTPMCDHLVSTGQCYDKLVQKMGKCILGWLNLSNASHKILFYEYGRVDPNRRPLSMLSCGYCHFMSRRCILPKHFWGGTVWYNSMKDYLFTLVIVWEKDICRASQ